MLQGIENITIIPKMFIRVENELLIMSLMFFEKQKQFNLSLILLIVWLKDNNFLVVFILNEEIYNNINPLKYMLKIKIVNNLLSLMFFANIANKKLTEGKKMQFISVCASSFSIWLSSNIIDVKIALLGNPLSNPIIIMLAPFPLILNNGKLINWNK